MTVTKTDDARCSGDITVIKYIIHDIDSVIEKISSLCKNKIVHVKFADLSHFADVTVDKLNNRLVFLRLF